MCEQIKHKEPEKIYHFNIQKSLLPTIITSLITHYGVEDCEIDVDKFTMILSNNVIINLKFTKNKVYVDVYHPDVLEKEINTGQEQE